MGSIRNCLLLVAAATCVASVYGQEDSINFALSEKVSAFDGTPIDFEFHTAPSATLDYVAATAIKPIIFRMGNAINFKLFQRVQPGHSIGCRNADDSRPDQLSGDCRDNCQNFGRYCEYHFGADEQNPVTKNLLGAHLVKESARRMCVEKTYGAQEFFRYMDAMHGTGCHTQLTRACLDQVFMTLKMDQVRIDRCIGTVDPDFIYENSILQDSMQDGTAVDRHLPSVVSNDRTQHFDFGQPLSDTNEALEFICSQYPEDKKPMACSFCNDFCRQRNHRHPDAQKCLWQLRCNDHHHTHFNSYLESIGVEPEYMADGSEMEHHPENPPKEATLSPNPPDQHQEGQPPQEEVPPDNNMAHDQEQKEDETEFQADVQRPQDVVGASMEPEQSHVEAPLTFALSSVFMALALAAFAMISMVTFRNYRSKMIIDQYLREQADKQTRSAFTPHLDPALFPDQEELDLDVEPALQYSDHINPVPPQQPPTSSSFVLPKIS